MRIKSFKPFLLATFLFILGCQHYSEAQEGIVRKNTGTVPIPNERVIQSGGDIEIVAEPLSEPSQTNRVKPIYDSEVAPENPIQQENQIQQQNQVPDRIYRY